MRKPTMRNAEINKTVTLKYSNRTGNVSDLGFGVKQFEYGTVNEMKVCLLNFTDAYAAQAYGVNLTGGKKATLTVEQAEQINEFTHIWIDATPSTDKQNSEYKVAEVPRAINMGLLVIDKIHGN